MATKFERIEVELPRDIIFAMRGLKKPQDIGKKLKIALALVLFQEKSISLGKATELAEMSRASFIELLKEHGIPLYEYTEKDFERDQQAIAEYHKMVKR